MKVRTASYILAGLFIVYGFGWLLVIPKFLQIYADLLEPRMIPLFTRAVLTPTAISWLLIFWLQAVLVVWKDLHPRVWLRNWMFLVVLFLEVMTIVIGLFLPLFCMGVGLGN